MLSREKANVFVGRKNNNNPWRAWRRKYKRLTPRMVLDRMMNLGLNLFQGGKYLSNSQFRVSTILRLSLSGIVSAFPAFFCEELNDFLLSVVISQPREDFTMACFS